jgi:hypothetical protein
MEMRKQIALLSLCALVFPCSINAQLTAPKASSFGYRMKPGTKLHYKTIIDEQYDDPTHTARYTTEYTQSNEFDVLLEESKDQDLTFRVTVAATKLENRSKNPSGQPPFNWLPSEFAKCVRFTTDQMGVRKSCEIVEHSDFSQKHFAMEAAPDWEARAIETFGRRTHKSILFELHPKLLSGSTHWIDTENVEVRSWGISRGSGATGSQQVDVRFGGENVMSTIRTYEAKLDPQSSAPKLVVHEKAMIPGEPDSMTEIELSFRASDGALQTMTSVMRRTNQYGGTQIETHTLELVE